MPPLPTPKPDSPYRIERCCPDLTHETFYVLKAHHFVAVCPSRQGAEDLVKALEDGVNPLEYAIP